MSHLAERLNAITPGDFAKKTIFVTTGAEAVENAVKIARAATGRSAVVAFGGGFHGRTFMGMALTGKVVPYKVGFGAMPADVFHVPFPIELHGVTAEQSLAALKKLFAADVDPQRVAAIIIEPVQGEGGFYPAPAAFMQGAARDLRPARHPADRRRGADRLCPHRQAVCHGTLRRRRPTSMTMAKSLAGGFPLAAVTGRAEIMDAPGPGGLGGTYGGNPIGIAAAHAVLDVIEDEKLCERAEQLGGRLKQRLAAIREQARKSSISAARAS